MKIKFYGVRGSVAISNQESVRYGGSTTCVRIESCCLPPKTWLVVDAGTGYRPMGIEAMTEGIRNIFLLMSHYHHDHTGGMLLAPPTYIKTLRMDVWGPVDRSMGPQHIFRTLMQPPFFPVDWALVSSHFSFKGVHVPAANVILIHPKGGYKLISVAQLEKAETEKRPFAFGDNRYPVEECMVVRMITTNHPDVTVSYRFEERATGKVFVFMTDHENTDGLSGEIRQHLRGADFAALDAQYTRERYEKCAGFGHGTPEYCVRTAMDTGVKMLGLIHHDPDSTDKDITEIQSCARDFLKSEDPDGTELTLKPEKVFACCENQEIVL